MNDDISYGIHTYDTEMLQCSEQWNPKQKEERLLLFQNPIV